MILENKIWFALSHPLHVNFFHPLIELVKKKADIIITARRFDKLIPMLEARELPHIVVGRHGGREIESKLKAYAYTVKKLIPIIKNEAPDLLITDRYPEAVRVAFGLRIPAWTIFYDERELFVNRLVFPLASKIFAPRFYTMRELFRYGVTDPKKVVWFNGFNACYLKGYTPDPKKDPFKKLGLKKPRLLVRPEPELAAFFGEKRAILTDAVRKLAEEGKFDILVMPRTRRQRNSYARLGVTIFDEVCVENPVAYTDIMLGAAETMLMESFVLGIPTISTMYWEPSRPVAYLHRYVPHSTDSAEIVKLANRFLNSEARRKFTERSRKIVQDMDNPIDVIFEEVEKAL